MNVTKQYQIVNSKNCSRVIQPIKKKFQEAGVSFNPGFQTGLYAEYSYKGISDCVVAWNSKGCHAEENLINYLESKKYKSGDLVIYLSTSPCSSKYKTGTGCLEKLEKLKKGGMNIRVVADHYYQPKGLGLAHPKSSSVEAAKDSDVIINIDKGPTLQL